MRTAFYILLLSITLLPACSGPQDGSAGETVEEAAEADEMAAKAIFDAARTGNLAKIKKLISKGANINARNEGGTSLLHLAVAGGHIEIVKFLVASGADINERGRVNTRLLHTAVAYNHDKVAQFLIASGADINLPDNLGFTPLDYAIDYGSQTEISQILRKHGGMLKDPYRAEIMNAAAKGDLGRLKELAAEGVDFRVNDTRGRTPLHMAAKNSHKEVVEFLIANGVEVDGRGPFCETPLYHTTSREVAKILLAAGADPNVEYIVFVMNGYPSGNDTILHKAVKDGNKEIVELLIAEGADINSNGWASGTPLHVAVRRGKLEMARVLIAAGADVNVQYRMATFNRRVHGMPSPQTPLDCAKTDEMKELLRWYGAVSGTGLMGREKEQ